MGGYKVLQKMNKLSHILLSNNLISYDVVALIEILSVNTSLTEFPHALKILESSVKLSPFLFASSYASLSIEVLKHCGVMIDARECLEKYSSTYPSTIWQVVL